MTRKRSETSRPWTLEELTKDRPLLPFLPLIYVAWADGELEAAELSAIADQVTSQGGLEAGYRERLAGWLDPKAPPGPRELAAILRTVRRAGAGLPRHARLSLAELGSRLVVDGAAEPAVEKALADLETALGLEGEDASHELRADDRPAPEPARERDPVDLSFDPEGLRTHMEAPYGEVRDRVKAILSRPEFGYVQELERSAYRRKITEWCRTLAAEGIGALSFPKAYGGADDLGGFMAAFDTIALHDSSLLIKFGVQFGLFGGSVLQLGTKAHHEELLERIGSMELPGCFAMSETGHGSNVQELETKARYDAGSQEWVISTPTMHDRKDWIGNAAVDGRMATVFAQLEIGDDEYGVHAFLVPIREDDGKTMKGVEIEDCGLKEGLNGVDNGKLFFDGVRVPRGNLLDRFASVSPEGEYTSPIASPNKRFFTMLGTLVGGRISVAGAAVSSAATGLAIATRYATRRRQFGPPGRAETLLLDYKVHQRKLIPRLAGVYALRCAHKRLVERFVDRQKGDERRIESFAAGLKAYASWFNVETLQVCREACGGQGYLTHNRISQFRDDTDIFTTFEGDNTVLMQLVTKARLTEYKHQFADMRLGGLIKFLASKAATVVADLNPVVTRKTDDDHLQDNEFLRAAFRYREDRLLSTLAGRLRRRLESGMGTFEAFNDCQDHVLRMAEAHIERVVAESILDAARAERGEDLGHILDRLASLFCLWRLERRRGWFLENGFFEGAKAKAIRDLVLRICAELRPEARALVDGMGIPEAMLGAPIAREASS